MKIYNPKTGEEGIEEVNHDIRKTWYYLYQKENCLVNVVYRGQLISGQLEKDPDRDNLWGVLRMANGIIQSETRFFVDQIEKVDTTTVPPTFYIKK